MKFDISALAFGMNCDEKNSVKTKKRSKRFP